MRSTSQVPAPLPALKLASVITRAALTPRQQQCYTDALNRAGQYACAAMDFNCLCGVPDWFFSMRDCTKGNCPPEYDVVVTNAASAMCASMLLIECRERSEHQLTVHTSGHIAPWRPSANFRDDHRSTSPVYNRGANRGSHGIHNLEREYGATYLNDTNVLHIG